MSVLLLITGPLSSSSNDVVNKLQHAQQDFTPITSALAAETRRLNESVAIPGAKEDFKTTQRQITETLAPKTIEQVTQVKRHPLVTVPIPWAHGDQPIAVRSV